MASHWVVMKRFVFLVICIAVGASLSGCASYREEFFNESWNESSGWDGRESVEDRFDNDGTSGGDPRGFGGP